MSQPAAPDPGIRRDLGVLASAVLVGGIGAALAGSLLLHWLGEDTVRNATLALATTLTAATHARLAHRQPFRLLVPHGLVSAPLVYLLMRAVHLVLGS